jgi:phage terminase small subunit
MPALRNPRHERFAQERASGKSGGEAYALAGYKPNRHNAVRLNRDQTIVGRINELLAEREKITAQSTAQAITAAGLTKTWVLERLIENANRAMQAEPVMEKRDGELVETGQYRYDGAVANRALELIGKEMGMFIERQETGKPGAFDGMPPEKKRERAKEIARKIGLDRVGITGHA